MARRVISLLGGPAIINEEDVAAVAITPGHLVDFNASGNLILHADAGAQAARTFALERDELGDDIDTAYAVGDRVKVGSFHAGQRVYAFLPSGQNLAKGDLLQSNGAGCLVILASGYNAIARSMEAIVSTAANTRVRAEII